MRRVPRSPIDDPEDAGAAEAAALRILGGAAQSAHGLQRRLELRGFTSDTAAVAVQRCRSLGYVDDTALAASLAARHVRRGRGTARVVADLRRRGMSRSVIDATTAQLADEQDAALQTTAAALVDREERRGDLDDAAWRRVAAALQRRGFGGSDIRAVLRTLAQRADQPVD